MQFSITIEKTNFKKRKSSNIHFQKYDNFNLQGCKEMRGRGASIKLQEIFIFSTVHS